MRKTILLLVLGLPSPVTPLWTTPAPSGAIHVTNVEIIPKLNDVCRDYIAEDLYDSSQGYQIGGPGCTVEVDESMFGIGQSCKKVSSNGCVEFFSLLNV